MEKLIKYLPLGLFSAYMVKVIVMSPTMADGVALIIAAAFSAFSIYKPELDHLSHLEKEIADLKTKTDHSNKKVEEIGNFIAVQQINKPVNRFTQGR